MFRVILSGTPRVIECEGDVNPKKMKTRILVLSLCVAGATFAQGPGGFGGRRGGLSPEATTGTSTGAPTAPTPPTPAQLAARQLQQVSHFLGLDAAQTSSLTGNTALVSALVTNETNIETYRTALQTDSKAIGASVAGGNNPGSNLINAVANDTANILTARTNSAVATIKALNALSPALTAAQKDKLTNVANMLSSGIGGGPGFGGPRGFRPR